MLMYSSCKVTKLMVNHFIKLGIVLPVSKDLDEKTCRMNLWRRKNRTYAQDMGHFKISTFLVIPSSHGSMNGVISKDSKEKILFKKSLLWRNAFRGYKDVKSEPAIANITNILKVDVQK